MFPKKVWGLYDCLSCLPDTFSHKICHLRDAIIYWSVNAYISFLPCCICHNIENDLAFIEGREVSNLTALQTWLRARFWFLLQSHLIFCATMCFLEGFFLLFFFFKCKTTDGKHKMLEKLYGSAHQSDTFQLQFRLHRLFLIYLMCTFLNILNVLIDFKCAVNFQYLYWQSQRKKSSH